MTTTPPPDDPQDGVPSEAPDLRAEQVAPRADAQPGQPPPAAEGGRRLYRSKRDSWFGGVAGGLADYFDVDPTLVRIALAVIALLSNGLGVLAYIGAWIIIPEEPSGAAADHGGTERGDRARGRGRGRSSSSGIIWGFLLVLVGVVFLLSQLDIDLDLDFSLWAVVTAAALILVGLFMVVEARRGLNGGLLALALILTAVLGVSRIADVRLDIDGAFGESHVVVNNLEELDSSYSYAFGSLTVDLRRLDVPAGETVEVEVSVVFGQATVLLPAGVPARLDVNSVFGSIEGPNVSTSGILNSRTYTPPGWAEADRRMDIELSSVFGQGKVD
ncbi:MAG: PspC domain-containing protein [Dehalococcoidia bacterium]|nr:PspC domain-containing protein [Dehalococcoidia bacterium]